jgi:phospholipid/cholesterol/gamma-HCH transport system substrate-binding protein
MRGNVIETVMGAVVLVVAALFLFFAYSTSQFRSVSGYPVNAEFEKIDGIKEGSDVRISGIKVGSVTSQTLDPNTFLATIQMNIDPKIKLPDDTSAAVVSSGLLGDKYLSLTPGGSDKTIAPGGKIKYTQSTVSLEQMIGQMIFSAPGGKKPEGGGDAAPADQPGGGAAPGGQNKQGSATAPK